MIKQDERVQIAIRLLPEERRALKLMAIKRDVTLLELILTYLRRGLADDKRWHAGKLK